MDDFARILLEIIVICFYKDLFPINLHSKHNSTDL
jgi:hypothetical protein